MPELWASFCWVRQCSAKESRRLQRNAVVQQRCNLTQCCFALWNHFFYNIWLEIKYVCVFLSYLRMLLSSGKSTAEILDTVKSPNCFAQCLPIKNRTMVMIVCFNECVNLCCCCWPVFCGEIGPGRKPKSSPLEKHNDIVMRGCPLNFKQIAMTLFGYYYYLITAITVITQLWWSWWFILGPVPSP